MGNPTRLGMGALPAAAAISPTDVIPVTQNMGVDPETCEATGQQLNDYIATPLNARMATIEAAQAAGSIGFATKALMNADLAHADGTLAYVTNDGTTANNGLYRKSGASGSGTWVQGIDRDTALEARATALETRATVLERDALNSYIRFDRKRALKDKTKPLAAVVIWIGQSNNVSRGTLTQAKTVPVAKMPVAGCSIANWNYSGTNVEHCCHYTDVASNVDFAESVGQSRQVGMISTLSAGKFGRIYSCSVAIGSRDLPILIGGGPRATLWAVTQYLCDQARADGFQPVVSYHIAQGEAAMAAGVTEATYYANGTKFYSMLQLLAALAMEKNDYLPPILVFRPIENKDGTYSDQIQNALMRLARDIPNAIDMGPSYQLDSNTDRIHNSEIGMIIGGEPVGRVLHRFFDSAIRFTALRVVDCTLVGAVATITFNRPIVKDLTGSWGTNLDSAHYLDGVGWSDNGTLIKVDALSYQGRKLVVTLHSVPTGTMAQQQLRIAMQATTSAVLAGPTNRSGSQIRASDENGYASIYDPTYTHFDWATPQTFVPRAP